MKKIIAIIIICFAVKRVAVAQATSEEGRIETLLQNARPFPPPGPNATKVHVNFYVRSIQDINMSTMSMKLQLTYRMKWIDPRLEFEDPFEYLTIPQSDHGKIWLPDIFFTNEKEFQAHTGLVDNTFFRVFPNGEVWYSTRITMTLSCPMDLTSFPFTSPTCSIRMASYGHTTKDLIIKWDGSSPIQISKDTLNTTKNFALNSFTTEECSPSTTSTGNYSCLLANFHFDQNPSPYISTLFVPMTLSIFAIWLSMFVPSAPARVLIAGGSFWYSNWVQSGSILLAPIQGLDYTTCFSCWANFINFFFGLAFLHLILSLWSKHKEDSTSSTEGQSNNNKHVKKIEAAFNKFNKSPVLDILFRVIFIVTFLLPMLALGFFGI